MAIVTLKPAPLLKSGELSRETVEAYSAALREPAWMTDRRLEALRVFRDTPPPNRHDEVWRRVDLTLLKLDSILAAVSLPTQEPPRMPADWLAWRALAAAPAPGQLLHVDGQPAEAGGLAADLAQQGVVFTSLSRAIQEHPDLLDRCQMAQCVKLTDSYFAALHGIFMRGGAVLYVPRGVRVEQPVPPLVSDR
jgi:Fe-S cluster assembly protein SufD